MVEQAGAENKDYMQILSSSSDVDMLMMSFDTASFFSFFFSF